MRSKKNEVDKWRQTEETKSLLHVKTISYKQKKSHRKIGKKRRSIKLTANKHVMNPEYVVLLILRYAWTPKCLTFKHNTFFLLVCFFRLSSFEQKYKDKVVVSLASLADERKKEWTGKKRTEMFPFVHSCDSARNDASSLSSLLRNFFCAYFACCVSFCLGKGP